MNRQQRRALAKKTKGTMPQLQQAVEALQQAGDLGQLTEMMRGVQAQSQESHELLATLIDDYQGLADRIDRLEVGQEVLLKVVAEMGAPMSGITSEEIHNRILGAIDKALEQRCQTESSEG